MTESELVIEPKQISEAVQTSGLSSKFFRDKKQWRQSGQSLNKHKFHRFKLLPQIEMNNLQIGSNRIPFHQKQFGRSKS